MYDFTLFMQGFTFFKDNLYSLKVYSVKVMDGWNV